MNKTNKEQLKELNYQVNLAHYLASQGYKRDKKKSSRKWLVLEKEGDKVLVLAEKGEKGYFYQGLNNETDRGGIVNFLKNRGKSFDEIRELNPNFSQFKEFEDKNPQIKQIDESVASKKATLKLNSLRGIYQTNYLTKKGIGWDIVQEYEIRTNSFKAIFPLFLNQKLVSTIEYNTSGKFFQKGLGRGLVYLGDNKEMSQIVIHESPVDALSYEQLSRQNGNKNARLHTCTCGSLTQLIIKEIQELCKPNAKPIIIAFDNDKKGDEMAEKLKKALVATKKNIIRHKALEAKDFNEILQKI